MKIITVADDDYAVPIQALAKSLRHHGHELTVVAVNPKGWEIWDPLEELGCEVTSFERNWNIKQFAHVPNTTYMKIELPALFPHEERILYLDGDMVCTGDLSELETIDMEGYPTAGVVDSMWPLVAHNFTDESILLLTSMIGYDVNRPAFNAGVLLMDVQEWNTKQIGETVLEFATGPQTKNAGISGDQGALAFYHRGNFKKLDQKWNTSFKGRLHHVDEDTRIIHWHGPDKPWNSDVRHGEIWHRYNDMEIGKEAVG